MRPVRLLDNSRMYRSRLFPGTARLGESRETGAIAEAVVVCFREGRAARMRHNIADHAGRASWEIPGDALLAT